MDWHEKYKDKIVSAQEAVSHIQSGDKVFFADWIGEPPTVVEALVQRGEELENVTIIHGMSPGPQKYLEDKYAGHFNHISFFFGRVVANAYKKNDGRVEYMGGTTYHKWPDMFAKSEKLNPHWALVSVTPPDENGICSFGNTCCFTEPEVRTAEKVIVQVNKNLPYVGGKMFDLNQADYIVEADDPLYPIGRAQADETLQKIADYCASLVEDGATVQVGIGALPDAILANLKDKKDLGVHTETMTEAVMELAQAGVITGKCKTINKGKIITSQVAGSQKLYDWCDHNPMVEVHPVDYTNDPYICGQNYKQTSINTGMEIDLLGQINSEVVDGHQYSGVGGQLDHVRGAQLSEGGKSIIAIKSTAKGGTISKIVPYLEPGAVVTVGRYDVQYVVTEYGIADLKYKTVRERAEALIAIAHPKFRDELRSKAIEMGYIPKNR